MDKTFLHAKELFDKNEIEASFVVLNDCINQNPTDCQSILLRGRIYYKMQKWGNAMNDYAAVLELDPDNSEAKTGIELSRNILGYFTPDMFNP